MNADQRRLFEETLVEDEAALRAQLERLPREAEAAAAAADAKAKAPPRKPRRNPLPAHLRRVEHRHEPEHTDCQEHGCGRPMQRIGEDVTERLDIVPAEFSVHRHIYGMWACRHCQILRQAPSVPEIVEGGIAASGLLAHTAISRFVDHLPYYRQETINARSGVHTRAQHWPARRGRWALRWSRCTSCTSASSSIAVSCCRRDAGGLVGPGRRKDTPGLHVGLRPKLARPSARRHLRVLPRARGAVPPWRS
jgi:transposase